MYLRSYACRKRPPTKDKRMEANEAGKKSCAGAILSKTKLRNSRKQEIDANQFMPPKPHTGPENGNLPHNGRTKQV